MSFEIATEVFADPFCLTITDQTVEGAARLWTIGRLENLTILVVVHTSRGAREEEIIRIISARKAPRLNGDSMRKLTNRQREKELKAVAAIPDDQIDLSDIPELTSEQLARAVRGQMYRPIKRPVTMRLDVDVVLWLKKQGPGYQTKANSLLRREMMRSLQGKKAPSRAKSAREGKKKADHQRRSVATR